MKVTKDSIIGDILDYDRTTAEYFLEIGMHCLGCPSSQRETLEQAAEVHGLDADDLIEDIKGFMEA